MRVSKAAKAIFIMVNYVTAVTIPPEVRVAIRLTGSGSQSGDDASATASSFNVKTKLFTRQDGAACNKCRVKLCKGNRILDPTNCHRCILCPPKTKPDPLKRVCVPDEGDKTKEQKYQETKEKKRRQFKDKKYSEAKQKKTQQYQEREKLKKDNEQRKKVRRMGRCIPLVALAVGAAFAAEIASEFFDEDYLESMELLTFWPEGLPVEPWASDEDDKLFEEDSYIDQWVSLANENTKRDITDHPDLEDDYNVTVDSRATEVTERGLYVVDGELEERFIPALIAIFTAIVGVAARVGARAASAAGQVLKVTRYTIKIGNGKSSKKSRVEQGQGAKRIAENKNWRNCLTRQSPQK